MLWVELHPPKRYAEVLTPQEPQNMTLFGNVVNSREVTLD